MWRLEPRLPLRGGLRLTEEKALEILDGLTPEQNAIVTAGPDVPVKVVAGAGTGKTETLTRRFLWLVQEEGYDPARILAVTFTEKAAAEMRARIRAALTRADREPEAPLAVHTFHGFARSLLTENCYRLGLSPRPRILSDVRQRLFFDRLFQRMCRGEIDADSLSPDRLAELAPSNLSALQEALQSMLFAAKGKGWSPEEFHARATAIEDRFYAALPDTDDLEPGDDTAKGSLYARLRSAMLVAGLPCRVVEKDEKAVRELYFAYEPRARTGTVRAATAEIRAAERETTRRFLETARDFYRLYEEERTAEGALDFDDLVNHAVALLRDPEVRDSVRGRFQYVLVDEFQDTSPMQMELIRAVCRAAPSACPQCPDRIPVNLTVVGDKKQAIYGWRNARRENMDEILPCPEHTQVTPLTKNHRSQKQILDLANGIRLRIEPDDPEIWTDKAEPALVHAPEPFAGDKKAGARRTEAGYVAECIQCFVQEDGTRRYGDIGVLVRKNGQFAALRRAFRDRGIPYVREGATGLLEEPTCKDVLAYLSVIVRPLDGLQMVRVLKRPPVGLSDRDLVSMRYTDDAMSRVGRGPRPTLRPFLTQILHPDGERQEAGAVEALARLAGRLEHLAGLAGTLPVKALLGRLPVDAGLWDAWSADDRAAWPNTRGTLEAIADALEEGQAGLGVGDFLDAVDLYASDNRLAAPASESTLDGVRVLTVHQAKGLEFPIVFAIGLGESPRSDSGWVWDDAWGAIPAVPDGAAKAVIAKWLRPRRDERADEEARCWYVAATRPKEALIVTSVADRNGNAARPPEMPGLATHTDALVSTESCTVNVSRAAPDRPVAEEPAPQPFPGPFAASFSAIEAMERCPVGLWIDRRWNLPEGLRTGPGDAGRRVGTLVHEAITRHLAHLNGEAVPAVPFRPDDSGDVRDRVEGLLQAFRRDWSGPGPQAVERPVRLTVPTGLGDVILSGYVDAVLPADDGVEVVDFKTNRVLDGVRLDAYALQMAIYRKALQADGESVAPVGRLVHIRADGCEEHRLPIDDDALDARLQAACERVAEVLAGPSMPEPGDGRDCERCGHGDICPHSILLAPMPTDCAPAGDVDLDLFEAGWHPLVLALAREGWTVDAGTEVGSDGDSLGTTAASVTNGARTLHLLDSGGTGCDEMRAHLKSEGEQVLVVDAGAVSTALAQIRDILEGGR